jgi:drug/metabolite transporter (DMT)-like permease
MASTGLVEKFAMSAPASTNHKLKPQVDFVGAAFVLVAAIGFSAKAIFIKLAYADSALTQIAVAPITLLFMRMAIALPFFLSIAWWSSRGAAPLTRRDWGALTVVGLMGYYGASLFDFWGLKYISAALERLILFLNPTIVVLLSAAFLGYRIGRRDVAALALSYAGIALVFVHDLVVNSNSVLFGSALVLISALLYAGYLVGAGQMVKRIGAVRFGAYASVVSTVAIMIHFLIAHKVSALEQPKQIWTLAAWMAIVSTVLPVLMMAEGMRRIGSSNAAMMSSIGPAATILLGYIFLNEPITWLQISGAGLVMVGVLMIGLKKKVAE